MRKVSSARGRGAAEAVSLAVRYDRVPRTPWTLSTLSRCVEASARPAGVSGEGMPLATSTAYCANGEEKIVVIALSTAVACPTDSGDDVEPSSCARAANGASGEADEDPRQDHHRRWRTTNRAIRPDRCSVSRDVTGSWFNGRSGAAVGISTATGRSRQQGRDECRPIFTQRDCLRVRCGFSARGAEY